MFRESYSIYSSLQMPLGHAICPQPGHSSGSAGDFEFSKKIKVADMLLHLDQTKHTFINKQQVNSEKQDDERTNVL